MKQRRKIAKSLMVLDLRILPRMDIEQNHKNKRNQIENPPAWKKDSEISDGFRSKNPPETRSRTEPQKQEKSD